MALRALVGESLKTQPRELCKYTYIYIYIYIYIYMRYPKNSTIFHVAPCASIVEKLRKSRNVDDRARHEKRSLNLLHHQKYISNIMLFKIVALVFLSFFVRDAGRCIACTQRRQRQADRSRAFEIEQPCGTALRQLARQESKCALQALWLHVDAYIYICIDIDIDV